MSVGSIIYIAIVCYIFLTNRTTKQTLISLLTIHIFTSLCVEVGCFFKIGDFQVGYNNVTEALVLTYSCFSILRGKIKGFSVFIPTVLATLVGLFNLIVFPLDKLMVTGGIVIDRYWEGCEELGYPVLDHFVIQRFFHYLSFLCILWTMSILFNKKELLILLKKVANFSKIIILIGFIEFLIKNFLSPTLYYDTVTTIFGYNPKVFLPTTVDFFSLYRLSGLTTEASHFAYGMFVIGIVMYAGYVLGFADKIWWILSIMLAVLSTSFSTLLFLIVFLMLCLVVRYKHKMQTFYFTVIFFAGILFISIFTCITWFGDSYIGSRLIEIFNDKLLFMDITEVRAHSYTSSRVRLVSIISTLKLFIYRPLFGIGIGTTSSHGSLASIISGLGILGTIFWLRALFYNNMKRQFIINISAYNLVILLWCIVGMFVGMFWGFLYNAGHYVFIIAALSLLDEEFRRKRDTIC